MTVKRIIPAILLFYSFAMIAQAEVIAIWQYNEKTKKLEKNFVKGDLTFSGKPFSVEWVQKGTMRSKGKRSISIQRIFNSHAWFINWSNAFRMNLRNGDNIIGRHGNVDPKTNNWTYIVVTYDGSGRDKGIKFYQDGKLAGSSPEKKVSKKALKGTPGKYVVAYKFKGVIKKLKIHDKELTADEVRQSHKSEMLLLPIREKRLKPIDSSQVRFNIKSTSTRPVIDGDFNDRMWQKASWYPLKPVNNGGKDNISTRFACLHDDNYLYFAIRCSEPEMNKIRAKQNLRDSTVWKDDSIELFIDTDYGKLPWHYQWVVNSAGAIYDGTASQNGKNPDSGWNSDIELKTSSGKNEWKVEMAIPLYELAFSADSPGLFKFNVGRTRMTGKIPQYYSYCDYFNNFRTFHDSEKYTVARLDNVSQELGVYDLKVNNVKMKNKKGNLAAKIDLAVWAGKGNSYMLTLDNPNSGKHMVPLNMQNRQRAIERITLPLKKQGTQGAGAYLELVLRDEKSSMILCKRRCSVDFSYSPIKVKLLCPGYNNAIYSCQKISELQFEAIADVNDGAKYQLKFSLSDPEKRIIVKKVFDVKKIKNVYSVPLPSSGLKDGDYILNLELFNVQNKISKGNWKSTLQKLPYQKRQVTFDKEWNCLVNGKAFFPFGGCSDYSYPKGLWDAKQMGFNTVCIYGYRRMSDRLESALKKASLKIITVPFKKGSTLPKMHAGQIKSLTPNDKNDITRYVKKWSASPVLLSWYTRNEAPAVKPMLEYLKDVNHAIRKGDPYHPIMGLDVHTRKISFFKNDGTTVVCPDPYPAFIKDGILSIHPTKPKDMVQEALMVNKNKAAVWCMLQAFNFGYFLKNKPYWREPRFRGLRNQMYLGIITGAKGILWYELGHGDYYPEIKYGLTFLARETGLLKKAFMAPSINKQIKLISGISPYDIHFCARKVGSDWFYFVTSTSPKTHTVRFKVENFTGHRLFVVSEQRSVNIDNGLLTDVFEPFQTHIYTTDQKTADKLSISRLMKKCAEALKVKKHPGNLLFGAQAKVSWKLNIDGVKSKGKGTFLTGKPEYMIDSIPFTSCRGRRNTGVITISMSGKKKISKVILDSSIETAKIKARIDGKWRKIADFKTVNPLCRRKKHSVKFNPVVADVLRIEVLSLKTVLGLKDRDIQIWEIEAYE